MALTAGLVLAASGFSAMVAYRTSLHHSRAFRTDAWDATSKTGGCTNFRQADSRVGTQGCISGRILRVYTSHAGNSFLDFCVDYRNCPFGSVIFASDRSKFGNLSTLIGRNVEIRGAIKSYHGKAEIIISDPQQIRVAP